MISPPSRLLVTMTAKLCCCAQARSCLASSTIRAWPCMVLPAPRTGDTSGVTESRTTKTYLCLAWVLATACQTAKALSTQSRHGHACQLDACELASPASVPPAHL